MGTAASDVMTTGDVDLGAPPPAFLDAIEICLDRGDLDAARGLIRSVRRRSRPLSLDPSITQPPLTGRELATLSLLPDATLSQKDMARTLGISLNTLKTHLQSLYQKLGAHSRAEAIELCGLAGGVPQPALAA